MTPTPPNCEQYQDELAELALGTLTGRARAETLAHVDSCGRCGEEVEELSRAADVLLQVAPESEPPVGFEVRLLQRLAETRAAPREQRTAGRKGHAAFARHLGSTRSRVVAAVAALSLALAGTAFGLAVSSSAGPPPPPVAQGHPPAVQVTLLSAVGRPVGRVVASPGSPAWLFMVVDSGTLPGRVTCKVGLAGGRWVTLGTFSLDEGYGTWSAPLAVGVGAVRTAELVSQSGTVVATASFPVPA